VGDSFEGDVCDVASGVSSVLLGRSDGAVINLIADGVGVIGGGSIPFGFLRFLGDGVAGGGILVTFAFTSELALSSRAEFTDEDDSLTERRIDMTVVIGIVTLFLKLCKMLRQIGVLCIEDQYTITYYIFSSSKSEKAIFVAVYYGLKLTVLQAGFRLSRQIRCFQIDHH